MGKGLSSRKMFQAEKVNLSVPNPDLGKIALEANKKGSHGHYTLAFMNSFSKLTDAQMDIKESYALALISNYMAMDRKFFSLEQISVTPTVLGGDYTYKVRQGEKVIGKLSISISITRLTGNSMCVIFNERNSTRQRKKQRATTYKKKKK